MPLVDVPEVLCVPACDACGRRAPKDLFGWHFYFDLRDEPRWQSALRRSLAGRFVPGSWWECPRCAAPDREEPYPRPDPRSLPSLASLSLVNENDVFWCLALLPGERFNVALGRVFTSYDAMQAYIQANHFEEAAQAGEVTLLVYPGIPESAAPFLPLLSPEQRP